MRDAPPMGVHQRISDASGLPENASPVHHPASDAVDLAFRLLARQGAAPVQLLPACTACRAPVASPEDILCGACHQTRRGPGRVLVFDPGRRLRTLARLSGRACETCGATDWHVTARGDAACRGCFTSSRGGADACTPVQIASGSTPSTPGTRTSGVRGDAA